ncbi:aspartic proteinase [Seiridium cupressi]
MKTSILYAITAALLCLPSEVIAQIRLPFARQSTGSQPATQRRSFPIDFFGAEATYIVNATVGIPPQNLSFALTLSADESWVPDTEYCDPDYTSLRSGGCVYGSYNHNESSTFVRPGTGSFSASYLDGNYAYGDRIRETMGFGDGSSVSNLTMGLAQQAYKWMGVMALGFNDTYSEVPNLPDRMLAEGLINSTAYSLWINDEDAASGNLLFGAVDKAAFDGALKRFSTDRQHYSSGYSYSYSTTFDVYIQGLNASQTADASLTPLIQNTTALPMVTIDPTFSVSVLPEDIATAIWALAGATYDESWDNAIIPCSYRDNVTARLALQLDSVGVDGGPILNVPVADLILSEDVWIYEDYDYDYDTSTNWCMFGVQTTNGTSYTYSAFEDNWALGGGMLKRQYMVFDLANEEVAMAPVKFTSAQTSVEDVVPFSVYGAKIPESTGDDSKCYADDDCSSSSSTSRGGSSDGSDDSDSLSRDLIGMIAGFSVLGAVMLGFAIWGIVQCCRDNSKYGLNAVMAEKGALKPEAASVQANATTQQEAQSHAPPPLPARHET